MWQREELKGKSFGSKCLFFFGKKKKEKREWQYYIVEKQAQMWAKMEYNLLCETLISNKLGKRRLRMSLRILNYGMSWIIFLKIFLKFI